MAVPQTTFVTEGAPIARVDGKLKVTGGAIYGSDARVLNPAYAYLVVSSIARGDIASIDDSESRRVPGFLDLLSYENVGAAIAPGAFFAAGGFAGSTIAPLASRRVRHGGQIVAVVLAESFEAAAEAAHLLKLTYTEETPSAGFDSPGIEIVAAADASKKHKDPKVGDADAAFAAAAARVDASYSTPTQHHNPIELFTTACAWNGDALTIWESSQNVRGFKFGVAEQLGISPDDIRVISPFVGGAFGSRGSLSSRTAIIALAARRLGRPVKLVATRSQGFTIATYRAETRHHFKLGADASGRLQALIHEGWEITSRPDPYMVAGTDASTRLYACPNIASKVSIVHADRSTPGFMRSPPELPYLFPLESAMDELAFALGKDPIELRRINDTDKEPIKGLPYTSRSLMRCFDEGAKAFGWDRRKLQPGSLVEGDWAIGLGCAATMYPTQMGAATARVTLTPRGHIKVQTAAHEIGNGAYTVIAMTAAESLGAPIENVTVEIGDSDLPPAPVAGGSNTTASVCTVVAKACEQIRSRIAAAAVGASDGPFHGLDSSTLRFEENQLRGPDGAAEPIEAAIRRTTNGAIEAYAENMPHGAKPNALENLYVGKQGLAGGAELEDRIQFAFGAEFVEIHVNRRTCELRCPRILGAFAAGRIVNARTAKSQLIGGLIWGVSSALHEATEMDQRAARFTNTNLADYLIPVNADIESVEVMMLPEVDELVNPLGIKGLGELGNVGTNAAVANALFNATGVRVRDLPIRLETVLASARA